jgi:hypothetical protein
MELYANLMIKNCGDKIAVNICSHGQCLAGSGYRSTLKAAVSRALQSCGFISGIKHVLISVDFTTRMPNLEKKISDMLYVQIHPTSGSQIHPGQFIAGISTQDRRGTFSNRQKGLSRGIRPVEGSQTLPYPKPKVLGQEVVFGSLGGVEETRELFQGL